MLAGFLGSLTGLGGGVVIIPLLVLGFGVDIRYAIGASLISVIATSSGAAAAYVKEGYTNIRIGILLEIATTIGALTGAIVAAKMSTSVIAVIFGMVLLFSAYFSGRPRPERPGEEQPDALASALRLDGVSPIRSVVGIDVRSTRPYERSDSPLTRCLFLGNPGAGDRDDL